MERGVQEAEDLRRSRRDGGGVRLDRRARVATAQLTSNHVFVDSMNEAIDTSEEECTGGGGGGGGASLPPTEGWPPETGCADAAAFGGCCCPFFIEPANLSGPPRSACGRCLFPRKGANQPAPPPRRGRGATRASEGRWGSSGGLGLGQGGRRGRWGRTGASGALSLLSLTPWRGDAERGARCADGAV